MGVKTMENLYNLSKVKAVVNDFEFRFKKKYGQNFLVDKNILNRIVDATGADENSVVLEIGPGIGTLAIELAKKGAKVYTIELDSDLIPILKESFREYPNIEVIHKDALEVDYSELLSKYINSKKLKVAANLPYYITTPLIFKILESDLPWDNLTLMMQLEVAQRISAKPGGKDYGALTVVVNYYGAPTLVTKAPGSAFYPQPNVDSAVININIQKDRTVVKDKDFFFEVVKKSFSQRRKTILNNLSGIRALNKEQLNNLLKEVNIDGTRRAETLTIEEFALISDLLY